MDILDKGRTFNGYSEKGHAEGCGTEEDAKDGVKWR